VQAVSVFMSHTCERTITRVHTHMRTWLLFVRYSLCYRVSSYLWVREATPCGKDKTQKNLLSIVSLRYTSVSLILPILYLSN